MFDLLEHTKNYTSDTQQNTLADHDSIDIEAMQQNNVQRWARSEELEVEILTMAGQMNAVQYRFIKLLAEFDDTGGWKGDGIRSFAHWLNWKMVGPRRSRHDGGA